MSAGSRLSPPLELGGNTLAKGALESQEGFMDSAIVGGLLFLRRLFAAPALAQYVICETTPGPGVATDDEPLNFARQNGSLDRKPTAQTDRGCVKTP
jgi:hypothetical protein